MKKSDFDVEVEYLNVPKGEEKKNYEVDKLITGYSSYFIFFGVLLLFIFLRNYFV